MVLPETPGVAALAQPLLLSSDPSWGLVHVTTLPARPPPGPADTEPVLLGPSQLQPPWGLDFLFLCEDGLHVGGLPVCCVLGLGVPTQP